MEIRNGLVWQTNKSFVKQTIYVENERILGNARNSSEIIDAADMYVIPGLIDIHLHGCGGYDFCDGTQEALKKIAQLELSWGITAICPAAMTLPEEQLGNIFANAATLQEIADGATLVGINMEGPFLAKAKLGAQNPLYLHKPDVAMFKRLQEKAKGLIKLVAIAPELLGSEAFIKALKDEVHISLAHTNATYKEAQNALQNGADHITHMFNAMSGFGHHEPGVVGAAIDSDTAYAELICDGLHVHPAAVRATFKLFGSDRLVFISDSMEATGLAEGNYELGGQPVTVKGNKAVITGTETIAGSVTNLMQCLRRAVQIAGIPLEQAVGCATLNPARSIGIDKEYGSLDIGKYADIVLLDKELSIKYIIKKGRLVMKS